MSIILSEQQLIAHSQNFVHHRLGGESCDRSERLTGGSSDFEYMELGMSPKIEVVVSDHG